MKLDKKGRVLIVDDDPAIRKVMGLILEDTGYNIKICKSGNEALSLIRDNHFTPDCILLDIRMPHMSGIDVLISIKRDHPLISIIMLTAITDLETAIDTMRKGAFDYLVKPVRKVHLLESIKRAINYRKILLENERLSIENLEYQRSLEKKVIERTEELALAYKGLKDANIETVKALAEAIEAKDPYTRGHCNRVRILSRNIAKHINMGKDKIEILEYGALLHDTGKIGISEVLLHKTGKLNNEERRSIQMHTIIGENIVKPVEFFRPCLSIIRNHHEWYNGEGYPDGLKNEEITISARIAAIADAFDAMTSTRPYRKAIPLDFAFEELKKGKGSQFDPELINIFLENKLYKLI